MRQANDEWERQNQDMLKKCYDEYAEAGMIYKCPVRKIACAGCGRRFYTLVSTKKYCNYYTCGKIGQARLNEQRRMERRRLNARNCEECGRKFTPTRSDARFCSNACRQKSYRRQAAKRAAE